jgi:hypothetical protein
LGKKASSHPLPDAKEAVADLDSIAIGVAAWKIEWPNGADDAFLGLARTHLPHELPGLIKAIAASTRDRGRRAALIAAARDEMLLDAWVEGTGLDPSRYTSPLLRPGPRGEPIVDDLALALLRAYDRAGDAKVRDALNAISPSRTVMLLSQLVFDGTLKQVLGNATHAFQSWEPSEAVFELPADLLPDALLCLAARAGALRDDLDQFFCKIARSRSIHDRKFWAYVCTTPPRVELVRALLRAGDVFDGVPARAIVGLLSADEASQISLRVEADTELGRALSDCRGGRPLGRFGRLVGTSAEAVSHNARNGNNAPRLRRE